MTRTKSTEEHSAILSGDKSMRKVFLFSFSIDRLLIPGNRNHDGIIVAKGLTCVNVYNYRHFAPLDTSVSLGSFFNKSQANKQQCCGCCLPPSYSVSHFAPGCDGGPPIHTFRFLPNFNPNSSSLGLAAVYTEGGKAMARNGSLGRDFRTPGMDEEGGMSSWVEADLVITGKRHLSQSAISLQKGRLQTVQCTNIPQMASTEQAEPPWLHCRAFTSCPQKALSPGALCIISIWLCRERSFQMFMVGIPGYQCWAQLAQWKDLCLVTSRMPPQRRQAQSLGQEPKPPALKARGGFKQNVFFCTNVKKHGLNHIASVCCFH